MTDLVLLLAGFVCAAAGGDLFVSGTIRLANAFHLPPALVGATLAAFGTSAPELAIGITAALDGAPELSFGDVTGSNVVNLTLILGLGLATTGLKVDRQGLRRDLAVTIAAPAAIAALLLPDGVLTRLDGALLLCAFAAWFGAVARAARDARLDRALEAASAAARPSPRTGFAMAAAGLGVLGLAAWLVVAAAPGIGRMLALPPVVVGAGLVALGTSLPELATLIASRRRGADEVGLGAILGSCIFNGFFILGVTASIHPVAPARWPALATLAAGGFATLLAVPPSSGEMRRRRGLGLLAFYAGFVLLLMQAG